MIMMTCRTHVYPNIRIPRFFTTQLDFTRDNRGTADSAKCPDPNRLHGVDIDMMPIP